MRTINWEMMKRKDVGAMGVGAMIVFIAMVLVAGIAAAVLIQTANRLEIQAMETGEQTKAEVATGINIVSIEGHKNGTGDIDYVAILISPRAGSGDIDLTQTYLEIASSSQKNVLKYLAGQYHYRGAINGDLFTAGWFTSLTGIKFGIYEVQDADNSSTLLTPVINRGDKVMILVRTSLGSALNGNIIERTDVWGMIQPEEGSAGVFSFRTPASYTKAVLNLY
jgi:flagellin FlaB